MRSSVRTAALVAAQFVFSTAHAQHPASASNMNLVGRCKVAIQTNNVEVDDRGYIYIVDRADTGMHILELSGDARAAAKW